ncbi:hypothetical protein [Rhizobacter sp. LjRoot28]|jgi:hypothetical protein|uniref:hypothetical protein n=1 Tax=Rhizobacter sp. LjRoot28 TaxID=3342309 RepID=UPI003ECEE953
MSSSALSTRLRLAALGFAFAMASVSAQAADAEDTEPADDVPAAGESQAAPPVRIDESLAKFCFIPGRPSGDVSYTVVRKLKVGKGTYGKVTDILPQLAQRARGLGAHAVVDYDAGQRFGLFPWRLVRPVVRGTAIRWNGTPPTDCTALGGGTLETIIAEDRAPADVGRPAGADATPPSAAPASSAAR